MQNWLILDREFIIILSHIRLILLRSLKLLISFDPLISNSPTLIIYSRLVSSRSIVLRILFNSSLDFLLGQLFNLLLFLFHYFLKSFMKGPWIDDILLFHLTHLLFSQLKFGSILNGIALFGYSFNFTFCFIFLTAPSVFVESRGHRLKKLSVDLILLNC